MEGGRTRSERRKRNLDDMPIEKGEGKKQNFVQNALTASELLPGGDDDVSL
jgi:hypothetical protein